MKKLPTLIAVSSLTLVSSFLFADETPQGHRDRGRAGMHMSDQEKQERIQARQDLIKSLKSVTENENAPKELKDKLLPLQEKLEKKAQGVRGMWRERMHKNPQQRAQKLTELITSVGNASKDATGELKTKLEDLQNRLKTLQDKMKKFQVKKGNVK